jgi:hypothetical protein
MLEVACEGLNITPEQLRQELEAGGDLPDLISGALTPKALRLMATTLALMRYPPENDTAALISRRWASVMIYWIQAAHPRSR